VVSEKRLRQCCHEGEPADLEDFLFRAPRRDRDELAVLIFTCQGLQPAYGAVEAFGVEVVAWRKAKFGAKRLLKGLALQG
jgi:hypothetical protein